MVFKILKYYLPLLLLSIGFAVWLFFHTRTNIAQLQLKDLSAKGNLIVESLKPVISSIYYWSQYNFTDEDFDTSQNEEFSERLGNFILGMNNYSQFRLIDIKGNEVLRLERTDDDKVISGAYLQDKKDRDYFQKSIKLDSSEIYISPLNLNVEFGQIEKPYQPVIRGSAPVFSKNGEKKGIVVINLHARRLLNALNKNLDSEFFLIDGQGNYLSNSSNRSLEFQNLIDSAKTNNFIVEHKDLWQQISRVDESISNEKNEFLVIKKLDFKKALSETSLIAGNFASLETSNTWYLISKISNNSVLAANKFFYLALLILNLVVFVIVCFISREEVKNENLQRLYLEDLKEKGNRLKNQNILLNAIKNKLQLRNRQLKEYNNIVAHNLKAPTTSMSALVSMVNNTDDYDEIKTFIPKLNTITKSISILVKDLLIYVRILNDDRVQTEEIDIEPLINNSLGLFLEIVNLDVKVKVDLEAWNTINFSKIYLQSIVQNLISNAIKYRDPAKDSFVKIQTTFENDRKTLIIEDNGLGIDLEKHHDSLFKLYRRFHRNISGRGMGLFLVKTQLESLNSEISVKSTPGEGSVFTITFNQNYKHHDVFFDR